MVRAYLTAIVLLLSACAPGTRVVADSEAGGPSEAVIAELEAQVIMPEGAQPLSAYLRTYYPEDGKVIGQYTLERRTGIRSLPDLETVWFDGGCGIVNIVYDPGTQIVEHAYCNGVA